MTALRVAFSGWEMGCNPTCPIMGFSVQAGAGMYRVYDGCND